MAAERAAFRSLLRACRRADKQPSSLLGLVGRPPRMYNGAQNREVRMLWPSSPFAEDMIWEALGRSTQFAHPKPGRGGARHGCRQHRARALHMDMPYLQEAQELYQRFSDAFQVMTEIETTVESEDDSYRAEPRPGGVPQVLQSFDPLGHYQILPGDFLMTHPISCIAEPVFDQAVVILHTNSDHPLTDSGVVRGLVLNKRLNTTFKQLLERAQDPQDKKWAEKLSEIPAAAELRVFRGGPVIVGSSLQANIDWVHSFPDVSEAQQVARGVWFGGKIEEVLERAAACEREEPPLRIMLGYAAWSTQQLQIELECGVWCRARAPQDDVPLKGGEDESSVSAKLCFDEDGAEAWRTALFQSGQDLLAQFPRAPGVDARIRGHMKRFEQQNRSKS